MSLPVLTLYSRPGCHLCDEMKVIVSRAAARVRFELREVDISGDAGLEREYGPHIPVLLLDGRKIAKYRISEVDLLRQLRAVRPAL